MAAPAPAPLAPAEVELSAADGSAIFGTLYAVERDKPGPVVLLFHQAGSNAAEYNAIAPRLQSLGFDALAIDQRSGGRRFGRDNRTVAKRGKSTGFKAAYADLEAALAWATERGHPTILAWGSSYTAALVFRLAAEHGDSLTAVLSFSPGEYLGREGMVAEWARDTDLPFFITSNRGKEATAAQALADELPRPATVHVPARAVHGSSMLRPDRNSAGNAAIWTEVERFLKRVVG
ncbi:MAG: alpha/beta hydrolase [Myxococcota bacterium]